MIGGLGIGATANLDPTRSLPSMFEPIHGSAFDIAGKGIANPIGALWTACLMLDHLGEFEASKRLMRAIETVTAKGEVLPHDLGGSASTHEVTQAIIDGDQERERVSRVWWKRQRIAAAVIPERRSLIRDRNTLERLPLGDPGSRFAADKGEFSALKSPRRRPILRHSRATLDISPCRKTSSWNPAALQQRPSTILQAGRLMRRGSSHGS